MLMDANALAELGPPLEARAPQVTVPGLLREQAERTPLATALRWGDRSITYRDLAREAATLARHLLRTGIRRDEVVGLCIPRSPAMIVGALGIMQAGAAYLPLDPAHPTARLTGMLGDAQARNVVTDTSLAPRFHGGPAAIVVLEQLEDADAHDLDTSGATWPELGPEDLAYVIYTSGSTGRPKGVEIRHASLLNLVRWHQAAFGVSAADKASALAGPAFDASVWEFWPHLAAGATVTIADDDTRLSPSALRDWLLEEGVTIAFMPTALAEAAIRLDWPDDAPLRFLLTGAEALHSYPCPGLPFALINNYGPTEYSVVATSGPVPPTAQPTRLPSIGRPIANTRVHLLGPDLRPVYDGEFGEIYVGGAGIARGYRNDPELTAERFVSDPFSEAGGRMYRTGDLARRLKDGALEFGGRTDGQVKIRGNRVEPEEVALVLAGHPDVRSCHVATREAACAEKQLVAYVVPLIGRDPSRAALIDFLRERVPEYMVPVDVIRLDALPLTPNGKVDRAALPGRETAVAFVEPSTEVERRVAVIVASLLKLHRVSANDDFFLLGGHSLLGTQLIARIRDAFGVEVALRSLFDAPTVAELGAIVEDLLMERLDAVADADVVHPVA